MHKLRAELPEDRFHVEIDDRGDVSVKRRCMKEKFDIEVVSISVKGVRINKDRE